MEIEFIQNQYRTRVLLEWCDTTIELLHIHLATRTKPQVNDSVNIQNEKLLKAPTALLVKLVAVVHCRNVASTSVVCHEVLRLGHLG